MTINTNTDTNAADKIKKKMEAMEKKVRGLRDRACDEPTARNDARLARAQCALVNMAQTVGYSISRF